MWAKSKENLLEFFDLLEKTVFPERNSILQTAAPHNSSTQTRLEGERNKQPRTPEVISEPVVGRVPWSEHERILANHS